MELFEIKQKIIGEIGISAYDAWFKSQPEVMEGGRVKFKARNAAKIHSPLYGTLIVEASSRFFRDQIIKKFGEKIHEVAKELGYSKVYIILAGDPIPQNDPPLTPEQWDEIKAVLGKIGKFSQSKGNGKAPKELFSYGFDEEYCEEMKEKSKPSHVYKKMDGLEKLFFYDPNSKKNLDEPDLTSEGAILMAHN